MELGHKNGAILLPIQNRLRQRLYRYTILVSKIGYFTKIEFHLFIGTFLSVSMFDFFGLVSWSIWHLVWVHGVCIFCSRASGMTLIWDFLGWIILQIRGGLIKEKNLGIFQIRVDPLPPFLENTQFFLRLLPCKMHIFSTLS